MTTSRQYSQHPDKALPTFRRTYEAVEWTTTVVLLATAFTFLPSGPILVAITATPLFFTTSMLELESSPSVSVGCVELLVLMLLVLILLRLRLPLELEDTERTSEVNHDSV